jgi:hypothetical protein
MKNVDLGFGQGKRDWTINEFQATVNAKYQLGLLALSQNKDVAGRAADRSVFPETVKLAKSRIEKVRDELEKKYASKGLTPKAEEQIWKEITRRANDPADPTFRNDWVLWYNYTQAVTGLNPDGAERFQQTIKFPATGIAARLIRIVFPNFATGPTYQAPPVGGLNPAATASPDQQVMQSEQEKAIQLGRQAAGF